MPGRTSLEHVIDSLTAVEREIGGLVASGLRNDEVASRRFVSVKTVEFHLTHIYRKLGIRSRAELAAVWPRKEAGSILPVPVAIARHADEPFVGRATEMIRLQRLLEVRQYGPAMAVIFGESGIGKSLLATKFALHAVRAGWTVMHLQCEARPVSTSNPLDDVCRLLETQLAAERTTTPIAPRDAAAVLQLAAQVSPLMLIVEDVHWADSDLLERLRQTIRLITERDIVVVFTARRGAGTDPQALAALLADLRRIGAIETMDLHAFELASVEELARVMLASSEWSDRAALDPVVRAVHAATDGVPFFVVETLRALATACVTRDGHVQVPLTEGIRDALDQRLHEIGSDAARLLSVAALVGDEFELEPVALACDVDRIAATFTLARAVGAELLVEVDEVPTLRYRFRHALVRDAAASRLGVHERAAYHVLLARAHLSGDDRAVEYAAHHLAWAGAVADTSEVLRWSCLAADLAGRDGRPGDACRYLLSASSAAQRLRPPDGHVVVEVESQLMEAAALAARVEVLESSRNRAVRAIRDLGEPELLPKVMLAATSLLRIGQPSNETFQLLDESLAHVTSSADEIALRALGIRLRCAGGLPVGSGQEAGDLLASARASGDHEALVRALIAQCWEAGTAARVSELRDAADELRALTAETPGRRAVALAMLGWAELTEPGSTDLEAILDELEVESTRNGIVQQVSVLAARRAMHLLARGRVNDADQLLKATSGELRPAPDGAATLELARLLVSHALGENVVGRADAVAASAVGPLVYALPAWARAEAGDLAGARRGIGALDAWFGPALMNNTIGQRWNIAMLADVVVALEDRDLAGELYPATLPYAHLGATHVTVFSSGPIDRALGNLAALMGRRSESDRHFTSAMQFAARAKAWTWRAQVLSDWAAAAPEARSARVRASRAQRIAIRCGLVRLAARARALVAELD